MKQNKDHAIAMLEPKIKMDPRKMAMCYLL